MKLEIRKYPDPVLAEKCRPVDEITPELHRLIADMVETMYEGDGVGLAAPQVGHPIRLVVVDPSGPKERTGLQVFVNPVLVSGEGKVDSEEGCLSVPGFKGKVPRCEKVVVEAEDHEGNPVRVEADDLLAIILQHELDHLEGTVILDRVSRLKRALYDKKVSKWQKQKQEE